MELGRAALRASGLNALSDAINPKHGLAWSDGKILYLSPVKITQNCVEKEQSIKLGEFDLVRSVHWSNVIGETSTYYLSVSHQHFVSVWKVDGEMPKLDFKQIRKVNIPAIHQGCLWNPTRLILCVLSLEQVRFFFKSEKTTTYALPRLESGKITAGAWTADGLKLVVCVGSVLLIYTWPHVGASISEFVSTAWKVPDLNGNIISIVAMSENLLACAAELPLESLCRVKDKDMLVVPDSQQAESLSANCRSNTDLLMNLQHNPQLEKIKGSQIMVVKLQADLKDPELVTSAAVPEILVPDILHFEIKGKLLVVGSNNSSHLQVCSFTNKLFNVNKVELASDMRPKGVCSIPPGLASNNQGILIMVGKKLDTNSTILPSSTNCEYQLWLKYVSLSNLAKQGQTLRETDVPYKLLSKDELLSNSFPRNIRNSSSLSSLQSASTESSKKLMIQDLNSSRKDIHELETEVASFENSKPSFRNSDFSSNYSLSASRNRLPELVLSKRGLGGSSEYGMDSSCNLQPASKSSQNGLEHLEEEVKIQNDHITELQERIRQLSRAVDETTCIFPTNYQPVKSPELLHIIHVSDTKQLVKKTFLLDQGRLQMEPLKQAFGLSTIELYLDGMPIVLSTNIDGYIPLKFEPSSTLFIGGQLAMADPKGSQPSPPRSLDTSQTGVVSVDTTQC